MANQSYVIRVVIAGYRNQTVVFMLVTVAQIGGVENVTKVLRVRKVLVTKVGYVYVDIVLLVWFEFYEWLVRGKWHMVMVERS